MNRLREDGDRFVVPYAGLHFPDKFEACWGGEFSVPIPIIPALFCFGSTDGELLFADQELSRLVESKGKGSVSGEAINGVAWLGTWAAVSTRQEVNFWSITDPHGGYVPHGAHGISATASGYFIAPLGREGILIARPPFGDHVSLSAYTPGGGDLYIYRVINLRLQGGKEVIVCSARLGGIVAGEFSGSQETHTMRTAKFKNLDVVDACPLCPDSPAVAALSRDGSLVLFGDVLTDKRPKTLKFHSVKGIGYRILCHRGDIYVLTSKGLYVLAKLGSRFVNAEALENIATPVLPLEMAPVDMNLAWGRWLLVVLPDEVRRFDAELIHDYVPQHIGDGEIQGFQPVTLSSEPEWNDVQPTTRALAVAH